MTSSNVVLGILLEWKGRDSIICGQLLTGDITDLLLQGSVLGVSASGLELEFDSVDGPKVLSFSLQGASYDISLKHPHLDKTSSTSEIVISLSDGRKLTLSEVPGKADPIEFSKMV